MSPRILQGSYAHNPCSVPWLSQSVAHTLLTKSPLHAWQIHPMLGNLPRKPTDATDDGQLLHSLLLGKGQQIAIMEHDAYRSNRAKEDRDNALAAGMLPVKRKDYDALMSALEQIRDNIAKVGVDLDGEREVAFEWHEDGTRGPVLCRGRMDIVRPDEGIIIDVKKTVSAHPKTCARSMYDYGMDIQQAAYTSALEKYKPEFAGRIRYQLVFIELDPPYAVSAPPIGGMMREMGQTRWQRAIRLWERCLATQEWPGYDRDPAPLEPTAWQMAETIGDGV